MTYQKKTHCKRGHQFTEKNTLLYIKNGYTARRCRMCRSLYDKNRYWCDPIYHEKAKAAALRRWRKRNKLSPRFDDQTSPQAPPADLPH